MNFALNSVCVQSRTELRLQKPKKLMYFINKLHQTENKYDMMNNLFYYYPTVNVQCKTLTNYQIANRLTDYIMYFINKMHFSFIFGAHQKGTGCFYGK